MIRYLDTSLIVSGLTREARTRDVRDWLKRQPPTGLAISDWVVAELSAALSIKLRRGEMTHDERLIALASVAQLTVARLARWSVPPAAFMKAAEFADHEQLALRAGDALHLAICAAHGATLCTLDQRQAAAGTALGVATELV